MFYSIYGIQRYCYFLNKNLATSLAFLCFMTVLQYNEYRMVVQTLKCIIFHVNILQEKS